MCKEIMVIYIHCIGICSFIKGDDETKFRMDKFRKRGGGSICQTFAGRKTYLMAANLPKHCSAIISIIPINTITILAWKQM